MKKNLILLTIIALFTISCGAPKKDEIVAVKYEDEYYEVDRAASKALANKDSKEEIICKKEHAVGTNFKRKRCTTRTQREYETMNARSIHSKNLHHRAKRLVREQGGGG